MSSNTRFHKNEKIEGETVIHTKWLSLAVLVLLLVFASRFAEADDRTPTGRQPIALSLSGDGKQLLIANKKSGTLSCLDTTSLTLGRASKLGESLDDLAITPTGQILALDCGANQLLISDRSGVVSQRLELASTPSALRLSSDGATAVVSSSWQHRVTVLQCQEGSWRETGQLSLPFVPGLLLQTPDGKHLLVADAFGGRVGVIELATRKLTQVHRLDAHAIRGMALTEGRLYLAHQVLLPRTPTEATEIHWGNVVYQVVRVLALDKVLTPGADVLAGSRLQALGEPGRGAADPAGLAIALNGTIVVTLGGVGEITWGKEGKADWKRLAVGVRPTAVVVNREGTRAFVADTFGDAVVVVDLAAGKVAATRSLGGPAKLTAEERGERLFYDARLSHEGWLSCHSCHVDGHSSGGLSDTLSDDGFGAPKRVLSLLGTGATGPWTWLGKQLDLEKQVKKSIQTTMHGKKISDEQVADLTSYLRSLPPPPPTPHDAAAAKRGKVVFEANDCARCHAPPLYTSAKAQDVGLRDEVGNHLFNPPSLRGVAQGGPWLHDGRAATLAEVFTKHRHPTNPGVPAAQVSDLVEFLKSL